MHERIVARQQTSAITFKSVPSRLLKRQCACGQHNVAGGECKRCRQKREGTIQRAAISVARTNTVPPIVQDVLNPPGQPLDAGARAFMEPYFNHDFSQVRVHMDAKAAESARAVNALAYTVGRDVVFGAGQYAPETMAGKRLMAHELTHVVQQGGVTSGTLRDISSPTSVSEREATSIARGIEQTLPYQSQPSTSGQLSSTTTVVRTQSSILLERDSGPDRRLRGRG